MRLKRGIIKNKGSNAGLFDISVAGAEDSPYINVPCAHNKYCYHEGMDVIMGFVNDNPNMPIMISPGFKKSYNESLLLSESVDCWPQWKQNCRRTNQINTTIQTGNKFRFDPQEMEIDGGEIFRTARKKNEDIEGFEIVDDKFDCLIKAKANDTQDKIIVTCINGNTGKTQWEKEIDFNVYQGENIIENATWGTEIRNDIKVYDTTEDIIVWRESESIPMILRIINGTVDIEGPIWDEEKKLYKIVMKPSCEAFEYTFGDMYCPLNSVIDDEVYTGYCHYEYDGISSNIKYFHIQNETNDGQEYQTGSAGILGSNVGVNIEEWVEEEYADIFGDFFPRRNLGFIITFNAAGWCDFVYNFKQKNSCEETNIIQWNYNVKLIDCIIKSDNIIILSFVNTGAKDGRNFYFDVTVLNLEGGEIDRKNHFVKGKDAKPYFDIYYKLGWFNYRYNNFVSDFQFAPVLLKNNNMYLGVRIEFEGVIEVEKLHGQNVFINPYPQNNLNVTRMFKMNDDYTFENGEEQYDFAINIFGEIYPQNIFFSAASKKYLYLITRRNNSEDNLNYFVLEAYDCDNLNFIWGIRLNHFNYFIHDIAIGRTWNFETGNIEDRIHLSVMADEPNILCFKDSGDFEWGCLLPQLADLNLYEFNLYSVLLANTDNVLYSLCYYNEDEEESLKQEKKCFNWMLNHLYQGRGEIVVDNNNAIFLIFDKFIWGITNYNLFFYFYQVPIKDEYEDVILRWLPWGHNTFYLLNDTEENTNKLVSM